MTTFSLSAVGSIDWVSGITVSADFLLLVVLQRKGVEGRVDSRWDGSGSSEDLANLFDSGSLLELIFVE
jgi:hypothetical protein